MTRRRPLEETELSPSKTYRVTGPEDGAPLQAPRDPTLASQLWNKTLKASRYLSWFHDAWVPVPSSKDPDRRRNIHWLHLVISSPSQQPTLSNALLAISLTRFGRTFKNPAILEKGRQRYARALVLLQQSLYDERLAILDETLATVGIMILYEVW